MKKRDFTIVFSGLSIGTHYYDYEIENDFFGHFGYDEFHRADINVYVTLEKKPAMLEFRLKAKGTVNIDCDLTAEPYDQEIHSEQHLLVKFGPEYDEPDEELVVLPHRSYEIDLKQHIYDMIVLSLPAKRTHPGVLDGSLNSDALKKLEELSPERGAKEEKEPDPRWDVLKKLK